MDKIKPYTTETVIPTYAGNCLYKPNFKVLQIKLAI